jgi:hypothetical protein
MGIFDKMKEPVFLKESSDAEAQLEKLKALKPMLSAEGQTKIDQDIRNLEYGIAGEKTIAYELKNSHMPLYILHDIYLEDGELNAQIDYLVFTRKFCFVVECKNLFGDIEITNTGDFIRTVDYGGKKKKEGIYSPITQNQRHLELIKKIKMNRHTGIISQFVIGRTFELYFKSIVVLANPKTVLNAKYAKKEAKEKVIRADQLVKFIKDTYNQSNEVESSDKQLLEGPQSFLSINKQVEKDYTAKYQPFMAVPAHVCEIEPTEIKTEAGSIFTPVNAIEDTEIFKELRAYRLAKSREENIKPYFIYNDNQLKDLISKQPNIMLP